MSLLDQFFSNRILLAAILAWVVAQSLKVVINFIIHRKFDILRFFGNGGMPSSHAAFVIALMVAIGKNVGVETPAFALAASFAFIVVADATGVRRNVGIQANVLNQIIEDVGQKKKVNNRKLKTLVGHTPFEVFIGGVIGGFIGFMF